MQDYHKKKDKDEQSTAELPFVKRMFAQKTKPIIRNRSSASFPESPSQGQADQNFQDITGAEILLTKVCTEEQITFEKMVAPGNTLISRFTLHQRIAEGGIGVIFTATDQETKQIVAIKILKPLYAAHTNMVKRFIRECNLASKIHHPNVCRIYNFGDHCGIRFITMEYIKGLDLQQYIAQNGLLSFQEAYSFASDILSGMQAAHQHNIIHRDLKPSNILIDNQKRPVLLDFGLAKSNGNPSESIITKVGEVIGTPAYISPEQISSKLTDQRTDIYALGALLFELFTGQLPF